MYEGENMKISAVIFDGVVEICLLYKHTEYKYVLSSRKEYDTFKFYYDRGWIGKAINFLKKNNIEYGKENI
jgi:hypothetical protein